MADVSPLAAIEARLGRIEVLLSGLASEQQRLIYSGTPEIAEIISEAAHLLGLYVADILSERRDAPLYRARCAISWVARETTPASLPRIGRAMRRDHTTIINQIRRAETLRVTDPSFRLLTDRLCRLRDESLLPILEGNVA